MEKSDQTHITRQTLIIGFPHFQVSKRKVSWQSIIAIQLYCGQKNNQAAKHSRFWIWLFI